MITHASASTSYREAPVASQDKFTERITSWLKGIEPIAVVPSAETAIRRTYARKTRQSKPYSRSSGTPVLQHQSHGSSSTDEYPGTSRLQPDPRQTLLELQTSSRIDRGLRTLPHPIDNPLITCGSGELEEEYARIVRLYNMVEERKQPVERLWRQRPSVAVMKELDKIELSGQRVIEAAQYIVDFAYSLRLEIDFKQIFLLYRSPSEAAVDYGGNRPMVKQK